MRLFKAVLFLTLVGTTVTTTAAPLSSTPKPGLPAAEPPPAPIDPERVDTLRWTDPGGTMEAPPTPTSPWLIRRRSPWDVQILGGILSGTILEKGEHRQVVYAGTLLSWADLDDKAWDFQIDVTEKSWIRGGAARRFTVPSGNLPYAPYWKVGVTQTLEAERMLSALVDLERLKVMGSVGFADLFDDNRQWTAEIAAGWGLTGFVFHLQGGWSFNW